MTSSLANWKENVNDYIVVRGELEYASGEVKLTYHIINFTKKLSHIIEDGEEARKLGEEMIAAGARVVSPEEARELLRPKHLFKGSKIILK